MVKNSILLFLIAMPIFCFSQQQKSLFFDKNWQASSSKHNQFYVCDCYILENGAFDGPFQCYKIDSDIKVKSYNFKDNKLDGEMLEYYQNGNKKLHAFYKNGLPINEWKEWDIDGNLVVDKYFDENSRITSSKKKKLSDYEKMYFGNKEFEAPVYSTKCILKKNETEKYKCSDSEMLEYYKHPPLPPSYFDNSNFSGKSILVKLKYQLSEKGKVLKAEIIETSGDEFLDDLAKTHVLNMIPFESAKEYENPIRYWVDAEITFQF